MAFDVAAGTELPGVPTGEPRATNEDDAQQVEVDYAIPPQGLHLQGTEHGSDDPDKFFATGERATRAQTWDASTEMGRSDGAAGDGAERLEMSAGSGDGETDAGTPYDQDEIAEPMRIPPPYISRNQDPSLKVDNLDAEDGGHH